MLKDAFEYLADLGADAKGIETVEFDRRRVLVRQGNAHTILTRDPRPREHSTEDLNSFVALTDDLSEGEPIVFVGSDSVVAILDPDVRENRILMPLARSRAHCGLLDLLDPSEQRKVIARLTEELYGCYDERLLAVIRRLDFTRTDTGTNHLNRNKETLGRAVAAEVQSAEGDIPEVTAFEFPLYRDPALASNVQVRHSVVLDLVNQKISFRPVGEELVNEWLRVRQGIRDRIASQLPMATVVLGAP